MKATVCLCLILLLHALSTSPAQAQEVETLSPSSEKHWPILHAQGKTYHNARLIKVEPDGLRITHDSGAAKIPCENLPAQLLAEFSFDTTAATRFRQQQQQLREEEEVNFQRIKAILHQQDVEAAIQVQKIQPRRRDYTALAHTNRVMDLLMNRNRIHMHCNEGYSYYPSAYNACDRHYRPTLYSYPLQPSPGLTRR